MVLRPDRGRSVGAGSGGDVVGCVCRHVSAVVCLGVAGGWVGLPTGFRGRSGVPMRSPDQVERPAAYETDSEDLAIVGLIVPDGMGAGGPTLAAGLPPE